MHRMGHSTMRAAMITNTPPTSAPEIAERLSKIVENESKTRTRTRTAARRVPWCR
jgi:hypothetical protein